jgi:hypothetical protein
VAILSNQSGDNNTSSQIQAGTGIDAYVSQSNLNNL